MLVRERGKPPYLAKERKFKINPSGDYVNAWFKKKPTGRITLQVVEGRVTQIQSVDHNDGKTEVKNF